MLYKFWITIFSTTRFLIFLHAKMCSVKQNIKIFEVLLLKLALPDNKEFCKNLVVFDRRYNNTLYYYNCCYNTSSDQFV